MAEKTCPVAETRRLSRSPPPLVSETRRDSASPGALPRELSFADAPLRSLAWPLFRNPLPYAGGQSKRSAPLTTGRNSRASRFELAALDRLKSGPPVPAGAALILCLSQFVFRSFSASAFCLSPSPARCHRGPDAVPSEDYSRWPPCSAGLLGEGRETETEQPSKKKTMKTQNPETQIQGLQSRPEQVSKQIKWNLLIGDEPYGFVHASSEAEALDRVRAFKRPFRAVPAPED